MGVDCITKSYINWVYVQLQGREWEEFRTKDRERETVDRERERVRNKKRKINVNSKHELIGLSYIIHQKSYYKLLI